MEQLQHGISCPNCRADPLQYFPDIKTDREIKSIAVYCHQKARGCEWKGQLSEIENHDGMCGYKIVNCEDCKTAIHRSKLQEHKEKRCQQRQYHCPKCNEEGKYCYITSCRHTDVCPEAIIRCRNDGCDKEVKRCELCAHLGVCPEEIIGCPNDGCDEKVKRCELAAHYGVCPQEVVTCTYHNIGCSERMKRNDITEHEDRSMSLHLSMAVTHLNKKIEEKACKCRCSETPTGIGKKVILKMPNIKEIGTSWYSPGFYTSSGGYKMSLLVYPNGTDGTHLSCFICFMPGEYDDTLEWPFRGVVTVELLNQVEDKNHHSMTITYMYGENTPIRCCSQITEKPYGSGWGCQKFLSHADLYNGPIVYIKDGTLYFRITVSTQGKTKPWLSVTL